jgi:hypothetical protein
MMAHAGSVRNEKAAGRILYGRTWEEMPPRTSNPVPPRKERLAMIEQVKVMMAKGAGTV